MDYLIVAWVTIGLIAFLLWANNSGPRKGRKRKPRKNDIIDEIRKIVRKLKINVRL